MRLPFLALLLASSLTLPLPSESRAGGKPDDDAKRKAEAIAGLRKQPKFYYPTAALLDGLEGHGICLVHFDTVTGRVREVIVTQSSGEEILDQAAVRVLRVWHIKPRTYDKIYVPFNFRLKDTSYDQ